MRISDWSSDVCSSDLRDRAEQLSKDRESGYKKVFQAILSEEKVLVSLYAPLMARLAASGSTVRKLTFSVERTADVAQWATRGEAIGRASWRERGCQDGKISGGSVS